MSYSISPRPTKDQISALLNFMEKQPNLALGRMKGGVEARTQSKKLWFQLARILNAMPGPTRPTKSWIKFWSDKKSNVKLKVQAAGGDVNSLLSNVERRIWDLFLSSESKVNHSKQLKKESIKTEPVLVDQVYVNEGPDISVNDELEVHVEDSTVNDDFEDRHMALMEKLVSVMSKQSEAISKLAEASRVSCRAVETLSQAVQMQANALDRIANTFESVNGSSQDVRTAMVDLDLTVKRFYNAPS